MEFKEEVRADIKSLMATQASLLEGQHELMKGQALMNMKLSMIASMLQERNERPDKINSSGDDFVVSFRDKTTDIENIEELNKNASDAHIEDDKEKENEDKNIDDDENKGKKEDKHNDDDHKKEEDVDDNIYGNGNSDFVLQQNEEEIKKKIEENEAKKVEQNVKCKEEQHQAKGKTLAAKANFEVLPTGTALPRRKRKPNLAIMGSPYTPMGKRTSKMQKIKRTKEVITDGQSKLVYKPVLSENLLQSPPLNFKQEFDTWILVGLKKKNK